MQEEIGEQERKQYRKMESGSRRSEGSRERQTVLGRDEEENERVVKRGLSGEKETHR